MAKKKKTTNLLHSKRIANLEKKILRRWPECSGIDIVADDVYNAYEGAVVFVGLDLDGTYCVTVQIDPYQLIRYCHLKEEDVYPNQPVAEGYRIGTADEWVRIEYCTTAVPKDYKNVLKQGIVRIAEGCEYFKQDPYGIVSGEDELELKGMSAYEQALTGDTVDYTSVIEEDELTPYIATLDPDFTSVSEIKKLKKNKVVGLMLYGGGLFDSVHLKKDKYNSTTVAKQVKAAKETELDFGIFVDVAARSLAEATEECSRLFYLVSKYPPQLGLWLKLKLTKDKHLNDKILNLYCKELHSWGLKGKIGIYCTESQLKRVSWDKHQLNYLLWLIEPLDHIEVLDELLTPGYFKLDSQREKEKEEKERQESASEKGPDDLTKEVSFKWL